MFFKVFFFNKTSFSIRHLLVFEGIHAELALICSFPVQRLKALLASCFSLQTRNTMQAVGAGGLMCMSWILVQIACFFQLFGSQVAFVPPFLPESADEWLFQELIHG